MLERVQLLCPVLPFPLQDEEADYDLLDSAEEWPGLVPPQVQARHCSRKSLGPSACSAYATTKTMRRHSRTKVMDAGCYSRDMAVLALEMLLFRGLHHLEARIRLVMEKVTVVPV